MYDRRGDPAAEITIGVRRSIFGHSLGHELLSTVAADAQAATCTARS
jgi:hypothetical protein